MTAIRYHGRKKNYREIQNLLAARAPFVGNTMKAETYYGICLPATGGLLNRYEASRLVDAADYAERMHRPLYVVFSYDTPIAWAVGPDGPAYVVEQKWGPTSGKHKGYARRNMDRTHGEGCEDDGESCRLRQTDCGCLAWECRTARARDGEDPNGLIVCRAGDGCNTDRY